MRACLWVDVVLEMRMLLLLGFDAQFSLLFVLLQLETTMMAFMKSRQYSTIGVMYPFLSLLVVQHTVPAEPRLQSSMLWRILPGPAP